MLISKVFQDLLDRIKSGDITEAHLKALLHDPDRVLTRAPWQEKLACVLREGTNHDSFMRRSDRMVWITRHIPPETDALQTARLDGSGGRLGEGVGIKLLDCGPESTLWTETTQDGTTHIHDNDKNYRRGHLLQFVMWRGTVLQVTESRNRHGALQFSLRHGPVDLEEYYQRIDDLQICDDEPLFRSRNDRGVFVRHGERTYGSYRDVWSLTQYAGGPMFVATEHDGTKAIFLYGERVRVTIGNRIPRPIAVVADKLVFVTDEFSQVVPTQDVLVDHEGSHYGPFDKIDQVVMHFRFGESVGPGTRPVFSAWNKAKNSWAVYVGKDEKSKDYDEVFSLTVEGNQAQFGARKGRRLLFVDHTLL